MGRKIRKAILGIGITTATAHTFNKLIFRLAVRKELLDYSNGKYFNTSNGKMFYRVYGKEGSPILLIHDINFYSSGYEWNSIVAKLSKNHKVYVVDLLGCGRSTKLNISYTSYLYVQTLNDFIENVIQEKTNIVASCKAVPVSLKMYSMNKNMIGKIYAISPEYIRNAEFAQNDFKIELRDKLMESPIWGTLFYNLAASRNMIEERFERDLYYDRNKINNTVLNAFYESAHLSGSSSKFIYCSLYRNYLYCNPLDSLNEIDYDNLKVVFGDKDESSYEVIKQYENHTDNFNYDFIKDCKKMPQLENARAIADSIEDFLK